MEMKTLIRLNLYCLLTISLFSCCEITGGCPPKSGELSVLDDSNPKVRSLVILNNSCKVCEGSDNYANENYLENKTAQKISVTFSYSSFIKQPDGTTTNTPITLTRDIEANQRLSIGCSCKKGDFITDVKIVNAN